MPAQGPDEHLLADVVRETIGADDPARPPRKTLLEPAPQRFLYRRSADLQIRRSVNA